ncbi:hypothetical protein LCGC14_2587450 [marine sediment metagenome]|uniref:Uncharacterized protein n=1 Tax=marine sediment metagenome TaxID=412755 RepID=A0A0F9D5E3_9ZZZZ
MKAKATGVGGLSNFRDGDIVRVKEMILNKRYLAFTSTQPGSISLYHLVYSCSHLRGGNWELIPENDEDRKLIEEMGGEDGTER